MPRQEGVGIQQSYVYFAQTSCCKKRRKDRKKTDVYGWGEWNGGESPFNITIMGTRESENLKDKERKERKKNTGKV